MAWLPAVANASAIDATAPARSLTTDARYMQQWVVESGDHQHRPFVVVDKRAARIFVFDADGRLVDTAPVLLGQTAGDRSLHSSVSNAEVAHMPLAERITPAGRFASEPGRNLGGEAIVWFDYEAGLAIHRVRPGASQAQRLQSLAADAPTGKRASLGCVVVSPAFFDSVLQPSLGQHPGVVYVLPEDQPVQAMFGRLQPVAQSR
ncbi:MAG: L,D-transpeptidase [Rhizobacter sp.]